MACRHKAGGPVICEYLCIALLRTQYIRLGIIILSSNYAWFYHGNNPLLQSHGNHRLLKFMLDSGSSLKCN